MRVLFYIERFDFGLGGVVQYVYQWTQALATHGCQITLVTSFDRDIPPAWTASQPTGNPRVHTLDRPAGRFGWLNHQQLKQLDEWSADCDVVHLHGPWDLGVNRWARRLRNRGLPYIVSTHGMLDDWSLSQKPLRKRLMLSWCVRSFLRGAAAIHCTALAESQQVTGNVSGLPEPVCIPPILSFTDEANMPDDQLAYTAFPDLRPEAFKMLFLSRIHYKKGIEWLLKAAARCKASGGEWQVLVAGPGEPKYIAQLQAEAERLGIADDVLWLGMVRDPVKTALYRAADVFVLPTQQENFGIVLVEAMAAGLPVITTRGTDIYREIEEGGALIVGLSADSLSSSLTRLRNNSAEREERGRRGATMVRQWLDYPRVLEQQMQLYRRSMKPRIGTS
ncbi:MAG TPA: glycosyltransferase [Pirellulaceae bacterium]|nr:glycosyltransferase [Pirellulaceae bacterium]